MRRTIVVAIATAITLATLSGAQAAVQTIEADNGAVYRIESIRMIDNHWRGGDKPYVMVGVVDDDRQLAYFTFTCEGSYSIQTLSGSDSGWRHVPPRSVAGRIAQIACGSVTGH